MQSLHARRWLLALNLPVSSLADANVIFPAIAAPYVIPLLEIPAVSLALVSEVVICLLLNRKIGLLWSIVLVVIANVASWLIGLSFAAIIPESLFPSGLIEPPDGFASRDDNFLKLALLAFLLAYVASISMEWVVYRLAATKLPIYKPLQTAFAANTISYFLLLLFIASRLYF